MDCGAHYACAGTSPRTAGPTRTRSSATHARSLTHARVPTPARATPSGAGRAPKSFRWPSGSGHGWARNAGRTRRRARLAAGSDPRSARFRMPQRSSYRSLSAAPSRYYHGNSNPWGQRIRPGTGGPMRARRRDRRHGAPTPAPGRAGMPATRSAAPLTAVSTLLARGGRRRCAAENTCADQPGPAGLSARRRVRTKATPLGCRCWRLPPCTRFDVIASKQCTSWGKRRCMQAVNRLCCRCACYYLGRPHERVRVHRTDYTHALPTFVVATACVVVIHTRCHGGAGGLPRLATQCDQHPQRSAAAQVSSMHLRPLRCDLDGCTAAQMQHMSVCKWTISCFRALLLKQYSYGCCVRELRIAAGVCFQHMPIRQEIPMRGNGPKERTDSSAWSSFMSGTVG